jgi:hypothetical protein
MKRWRKILLGLSALLLLLLLIGFMLPAHVAVQRTTFVKSQPADLFPYIANLKRWAEWTDWTTNRFPDMTMTFEGPETGAGAIMSARGKSSGNGVVKITRADPTQGVWYDLDFNDGMQRFQGVITLVPTGDTTRVIWRIEADMGRNPVKRWAGVVLDKLMGGDMAKGLAKLEELAEISNR